MGNNFLAFVNNFYFCKIIPVTSASMPEDCISKSQDLNETRKVVEKS